MVSAFAGAAFFTGTAVLLAKERISRTWPGAPHGGDGAPLLSQADTLVESGPTFALAVIMARVLIVAAAVATSRACRATP